MNVKGHYGQSSLARKLIFNREYANRLEWLKQNDSNYVPKYVCGFFCPQKSSNDASQTSAD